ncbi:hypothetical protein D9M72_85890 [compost metagenome]
MKIWTTEEEAAALRDRFVGINRAQFARLYKVKGGQAMIYQHINGLRPVNLEAATVYAKAFGCTLADISPRLAKEVHAASAYADADSDAAEKQSEQIDPWPFQAAYSAYQGLSDEKKQQLDAMVTAFIAGASPVKSLRGREKAA